MARLPFAERSSIPDDLVYVWDRNAPPGGGPYLRLGNGLWTQCGLDVATRELVILRTAILHHSLYEWHQHVRIGRQAGLTDERIVGLHHWRTSELYSESERALLGYVDAIGASDHPSDDAHAELARHFDASTIVGINLLSGFYGMTAKFLGAMEVETEEPFIGWQLNG
jgi:alkylhydroperoxidase family enzyme